MRKRFVPAIVVFVGLMAVSCGGSGQLTDPSRNTDQVFTGVIPAANPPGVSTTAFDFFTVASPGLVTVTLNSITPPLALLFTVEIDLAVASSDKTQCSASPLTGNALQVDGRTSKLFLNNVALNPGTYCFLFSDLGGRFTASETYTVTINHP